jgi:hypothetical protein
MVANVVITALVAAVPEFPPAAYVDCAAAGATPACVRARPSDCGGGATAAIVVPVRIVDGAIEVVGSGDDLQAKILDGARAVRFRSPWAREFRALAFAPSPGVVTYLLAFVHDAVECQGGFPMRGDLELEYAGHSASLARHADAPIPVAQRLHEGAAAAVAKLIEAGDPRTLVRDACFTLPR